MSISRRKVFLPTLLSFALLLALSLPAAAQQSRAVKGKVTDEKGQPVVDAQITIQDSESNRNFVTKTNKKGEFLYLLGLQLGVYRVVVRKQGYQPQYKENIRPELGQQFEVNFQLAPGQDQKLPFEMTDAEREQFRQQTAQSEKRRQFSAEVKAHFDLAVQLSEQGKQAEAVDEFNKAIEKDPKQPGILARLGDTYMKMQKYDDALATYQKAAALGAADPVIYTNMGVVLSKLGKVAESQEAFKKAAAMSPGSAAQNYYNLGVTMFNSGNQAQAVDAFKQAIAADPNYADSYFQLGICLSGKPETAAAAIEAFQKYVQIGQKPDQVEVAKQMIVALKAKK